MYNERHAPKPKQSNTTVGRVMPKSERARRRTTPARSPFERAADAAEKSR
jgi:hypothetical protein